MARRGRRSKRRTAARKRAQRAAKKRVSARKAAGKKPSGAKSRSQAKADNRARAQAAAKKRIASGRTISQTKAANKKKMQDAARERNRKFQAEKAAAAKRRADAAAKKKADAAAKKAAADKAAAAKKAAEAKKTNDVQNDTKIASSLSGGTYGGYVETRSGAFVSPEQAQKMLTNPDNFRMSPADTRYLRESMGLPRAQAADTNLAAAGNMTNLGIRNNEATAFKQKDPASYGYPSQSEVDNAALGGGAGFIGRKPTGNPNVMSADGTFNRPGPGGPEPESDYTSYQSGSYYNQSDTNMNLTNALRSTRNLVTSPARALGINNRLTNMLIPKSNEAIQDARDQRGPRPNLRNRGGGGGNKQMQVTPPPPTREEVEQQAQAAMPEGTVTPIPEQTQPTESNMVTPPPRMIDVGGGQQISADNMAEYLASLRGTWDQQSQQYQSQIGQLQGQIGGYETQVGGLQGQIGTLQGQVGDYQGQIGGLQSDIGGYKTASERQQQLLDQYQMQIGGLQSDISGYRGRVSEYEKSLGDYRTQVGGLRRDIGDYKTQIGGLQSDIGGYRSQIGSLQSDIGGYKGQIGELQGDIKGYQGEISGLRGDVLGLRGDISNYQARERKAQEMQIRDAQRQRVAQSYGLGKKKPKVGGVKTGRIEEEARMYGPRATFNRSGLRISSLNI